MLRLALTSPDPARPPPRPIAPLGGVPAWGRAHHSSSRASSRRVHLGYACLSMLSPCDLRSMRPHLRMMPPTRKAGASVNAYRRLLPCMPVALALFSAHRCSTEHGQRHTLRTIRTPALHPKHTCALATRTPFARHHQTPDIGDKPVTKPCNKTLHRSPRGGDIEELRVTSVTSGVRRVWWRRRCWARRDWGRRW